MFLSLKMSHSFIRSCCWITQQVSHIIKDERLASKMEGKTNISRCLRQFDGLTWLTPTPIFYDRPTPLVIRATCVCCYCISTAVWWVWVVTPGEQSGWRGISRVPHQSTSGSLWFQFSVSCVTKDHSEFILSVFRWGCLFCASCDEMWSHCQCWRNEHTVMFISDTVFMSDMLETRSASASRSFRINQVLCFSVKTKA